MISLGLAAAMPLCVLRLNLPSLCVSFFLFSQWSQIGVAQRHRFEAFFQGDGSLQIEPGLVQIAQLGIVTGEIKMDGRIRRELLDGGA
jgi:hypothetical protein